MGLRADLTEMFECRVQPHLGDLQAFVHHWIDNPQDAEDVFQDILVAAYLGLENFHGDAEIETWLFDIARHKICDYFRGRGRQPPLVPLESCPLYARDDVVRACAAREDIDGCVACTRRCLPPAQCQVLVLVEVDDDSVQEAAEIMGIELSDCKDLLHRARVTMRRLSCGGCRVVLKANATPECPLRRRME